jgi:hypothetical protein
LLDWVYLQSLLACVCMPLSRQKPLIKTCTADLYRRHQRCISLLMMDTRAQPSTKLHEQRWR